MIYKKQKEQSEEEYMRVICHELKTPITALSLYSELLEKEFEVSQNKNNLHLLKNIQGQISHLVELIDELMVKK